MKVILLIFALASPVMAQGTYDFTLVNDPNASCTCSTIVGSGMFTVSPTYFQSVAGSGYPITSLTGTLNGATMTLALVPGPIGNLYVPNLVIPSYAPLNFSTSSGLWTIVKQTLPAPGSAQWLTDPSGKVTYVSFTATLAPQFSSHPVFPSGGNAPVTFQRNAPSKRQFQPISIEISVPAAIAMGVAIYEWHHRRTRREAYPAGRF